MTRTALANPPAKARLLDAAQALMLARGFAATTVDEICHQAKLTKGSFFHYFKSKDALGQALLRRFCETGDQLHRSLCGSERDPLKRVYRYIDEMIRLSRGPVMGKGCLLGTFAQELSDTHPDIRKMCSEAFSSWAVKLAADLQQAKRMYAPRAAFNPHSLAEHFIAVLEGAQILSKTQQDSRIIRKSLEHFKAYLKTLYGR